MKQLLAFVILLFTVSAFGANPSYKDFRGINGILVTSNPPQGTIVFDGSGIMGPTGGVSAATATNIVLANSSLVAPPISSVQFNSNGVMQGSSGFVFTNGLVGIGTTTPDSTLHVNGALTVVGVDGNSAIVVSNSLGEHRLLLNTLASGGWVLYDYGGSTFNDGIGQVGGNVGIGTLTPANRLDVEGGAAIGATYSGIAAAPANGLLVEGSVGIGTVAPGSKLDIKDVNPAITYNRDGGWLWRAGVSGGSPVASSFFYIQDVSGAITPFTIAHSSGYVGIGTTFPSSTLDVTGQVRMASGIVSNMVTFWPPSPSTRMHLGMFDGTFVGGIPGLGTNFGFFSHESGRLSFFREGLPTNENWTVTGGLTISNMVGSGDHVAVNAAGRLMRTNITGGGGSSVAAPISSVQFNSNGVMQGSAAFTFTNGLVGIGTALPAVALHINNDGAVSSPHLRFEKAAADVRWDFAISSNPETYNLGLGRVGDATYAMVWELGGNVGIGTTNPATRFDVQGRTTLRSNVFFPNISSNASPVAFLATDAAGEVFETAGVPGAAGANFEVQFNNAGVMGASPNLRFVGGGYQLQIINPTVPGEVDINGEGFISQGVGGASLAFGIGALTNLMIQGDGAVIVRPSVNINTNIFQIEATNKVPIVLVDTNGNFFVQRGLSVGPLGSATLTNTLYASATLDFPSTVAGTVSDLPITVAGAADGDIIALGEPSGSIGPLTGVYNAWASNGVVYVRFANNNLVTAQDPASGTFKVRVDKFK